MALVLAVAALRRRAVDPKIRAVLLTLRKSGWAHSMQVHPDGNADYVSHRPSQLDKTVRWIARPGDQDACGFAMPATAEPEGYTAEKAKGNIRILPGGGQFRADFTIGTLDAGAARQVEQKINAILAGK